MDQYTCDLMTKWGLMEYIDIFAGARIDILALQMLEDKDIQDLITPIGDRLKFKSNLALWKEESNTANKQLPEHNIEDISINTAAAAVDNLLDLDFPLNFNSSGTSTPTNRVQKLQIEEDSENNLVRRILKKTHEGRAILAQKSGLLSPELRRELSNLIIKDLLDEDPKATISNPTFMRLAHEIAEIFPEESPVVFYAPYIKATNFQPKRNCSGLLYSIYTNKKRRLRNLGVLPKCVRASSSKSASSLSDSHEVLVGIDIAALGEEEEEIVQEKLNILENAVTGNEPWQKVEALWEDTTKARLRYLYYEKGTLKNYFDRFPILKKPLGYELMVKDFERLYPNNSNKLLTTFQIYCQPIITIANKKAASCKDALLKKLMQENLNCVEGSICGGDCCGRGREVELRSTMRRLAVRRAVDATRPVADLLTSTERTLRDHLIALSHLSQNETAVFLYQVTKSRWVLARAPLTALYDDIRAVLKPPADRDLLNGDNINTAPTQDLTLSVKKFFRDIFPVAYHYLMKLDGRQFKPEYEACLKDAYDAVQPFGDTIPKQLGTTIKKSLEAARALFQALAVSAGALAASEEVISTIDQDCSDKLLKVMACSRCRGYEKRPCRNYCLNVARGCLGSLVAELDRPWTNFVEGVERLSRADADEALRALDDYVSQAIMHAFKYQAVLNERVRQECGPPNLVDGPEKTQPTQEYVKREHMRAPPADAELLQFAANLANKKKLFAKLADKLCDLPDFAGEGNEECWNGETIGAYSKPLVASTSMSDQRYNPEITGGAPPHPQVAAIAEKFLKARQLLVESWSGSSTATEAFMQGDEAEEEGSGYERIYSEDDAAYDAEGSGEEGSGNDEIHSRTALGKEDLDKETTTPKTKAASTSRPLLSFILLLAFMNIGYCLT